jgi:hypothetical protein
MGLAKRDQGATQAMLEYIVDERQRRSRGFMNNAGWHLSHLPLRLQELE